MPNKTAAQKAAEQQAADEAAAAQKAADEAAAAEAAARDNSTAPGTDAPEPHDATNTESVTDAPGVASSEEVEAQRSDEEKAALAAAEARGEGGAATPSEKGQQTKAASDVREQAAADAESRMSATEEAASDPLAPNYETDSDDPVQAQRREEAEVKAAAAAGDEVSEKDALLLAAAPGGQRTALTDGREGSTMVTHTAASPAPPLAGPLHHPVNDITNLAATEDDPDNRVYADEAGPRDVFEGTEAAKARYVDADGNKVGYDDIFDDPDANKTFVVTKARIYEVFVFPNTTTEGRRLAYAAGKRVPRGEAENVRNQISVHSPIV